MATETEATDDAQTAAEQTATAAEQFAADPCRETFMGVQGAVHAEWRANGYNPITGAHDETVLTPLGQAVASAADASGYNTKTMIDFDGNDEIAVGFTSDDVDAPSPYAIPTELVRLVAYADEVEPNRRVWMEMGDGEVQVYVDRTPLDKQ